jgi:hypothetical protein
MRRALPLQMCFPDRVPKPCQIPEPAAPSARSLLGDRADVEREVELAAGGAGDG